MCECTAVVMFRFDGFYYQYGATYYQIALIRFFGLVKFVSWNTTT